MQKLTSLTEIERVVGDDKAALKTFLSAFISQTSSQIIQLEDCLAENNIPEIKNIIHKMKSTIGYFGMTEQKIIAEQIELSKDPDIEKIKPQVQQFTLGCSQAVSELKETLSEME